MGGAYGARSPACRHPLANAGQFDSKSLMLKTQLHAVAGAAVFPTTPTLDKTMSERKHLVSAEVEKLLAATKGSKNEDRDLSKP